MNNNNWLLIPIFCMVFYLFMDSGTEKNLSEVEVAKKEAIEQQILLNEQNLDSFLSTPFSEVETDYKLQWISEHIIRLWENGNLLKVGFIIFMVVAGGVFIGLIPNPLSRIL